jgi:hypothetical protein
MVARLDPKTDQGGSDSIGISIEFKVADASVPVDNRSVTGEVKGGMIQIDGNVHCFSSPMLW